MSAARKHHPSQRRGFTYVRDATSTFRGPVVVGVGDTDREDIALDRGRQQAAIHSTGMITMELTGQSAMKDRHPAGGGVVSFCESHDASLLVVRSGDLSILLGEDDIGDFLDRLAEFGCDLLLVK